MNQHIAFCGDRCLMRGELVDIALELRRLSDQSDQDTPVLIFEEQSGRQIDLDLRGSDDDVIDRYGQPADKPAHTGKRGRPKLGVIGREVTLLPRHWEWLESQRGGASAALRRLVDAARKSASAEDTARAAQDRTNRFVSAIAGDLPGYEEATRALYSGDRGKFEIETAEWPADIRKQALLMAADAFGAER